MNILVIEEIAFDGPLAEALIAELQQEYVTRYGGPDETVVDARQFASPYGAFFVANFDGEPIGCAGLRRHDDDAVEVKRMFVRSTHRRCGHGRALLRALEDRARAGGYRRVILETGLKQPEAVALYIKAGYAPIDGFGHYRDSPLSRSFAKEIDGN